MTRIAICEDDLFYMEKERSLIEDYFISVKESGMQDANQMNVFVVLIGFAVAFLDAAIIHLFVQSTKRQKHILENEAVLNRVKNETMLYRSITDNMEKQSRRIHEFNNRMAAIKSMLDQGKIEELQQYVDSIETKIKEYEHYSKMMDLTGDIYEKIRKEENREIDMNDIMKTMMDTYETLYNDILKAHENGDREVDYQITGKQSITLEQDLAGLDKAFNRRLSNLEGYITTQQTNKQFEGSARDTMEYIKRVKGLQTSETTERINDDFNYFETDYQNTVKSIMEQARDSFLQQISSGTYKKGAGVNVLLSIMQTNTSFIEGTQKLFS